MVSGIHAELEDAMAAHARTIDTVHLVHAQMMSQFRTASSAKLIGQLVTEHRDACLASAKAADVVLSILARMGLA